MSASWKSPNLAVPTEGSTAISIALAFAAVALIDGDLAPEMLLGKIDFIQSVYIDNADNSTVCDLTVYGAPIPQRIRAQAFTQGWYPLSVPIGRLKYRAASNSGATINVIFSNFAMPYVVWGPPSGITVVPPLSNKANAPINFAAAGNAQLVAGVALQTVKLYRGIFESDQPVVLQFTDGPGGTVLFTAQLTAGGSLTLDVSGVPWFNSGAGNDLTLHASAACNIYGGFGYVQS